MRICYSEEDDADFHRWTKNLMDPFIQDGRVMRVRQFGEPDVMLASVWRPHLWPDIPVILVSNENWDTDPGFRPLDRYLAVLGIYRPAAPCRFIQFPYAAVHFEQPIATLYEQRARQAAIRKQHLCCFVASNPRGHLAQRRVDLFQHLNTVFPVHSGGGLANNIGYRAPRGANFLTWISAYKYMICLENSSVPGYITEKAIQAWLAGTVPIYDGGAKSMLNPAAFIDASGDVLGEIRRLEADPAAYEAMRMAPLTLEPISLEPFQREFAELIREVDSRPR